MNRFLLDTNIFSNITKAVPSERLLAWMGEQADETLFVATLTLAEIWRGILEMPVGRKRERLEAWFVGPEGPPSLFAGRVLAFDEQSALVWARLMADGTAIGRSVVLWIPLSRRPPWRTIAWLSQITSGISVA